MSAARKARSPIAERFSGFSSTYDRYRPKPPAALPQILIELAQTPRPQLVVDIGCGTGLATRLWAKSAARVIGIDVSADMIGQARRSTRARNVTFREGFAHATGLPARCADIVTCSQALHWMKPGPTFREVARVLRRGGVFAAIDCNWPPITSDWRADVAYREFQQRSGAAERKLGIEREVSRWSKGEHLERMRASGRFRYAAEILLHSRELGNADRLVGLALSFGSIQDLLKAGLSEKDIGLDILRRKARQYLGDQSRPWHFSYRVRVGIV